MVHTVPGPVTVRQSNRCTESITHKNLVCNIKALLKEIYRSTYFVLLTGAFGIVDLTAVYVSKVEVQSHESAALKAYHKNIEKTFSYSRLLPQCFEVIAGRHQTVCPNTA